MSQISCQALRLIENDISIQPALSDPADRGDLAFTRLHITGRPCGIVHVVVPGLGTQGERYSYFVAKTTQKQIQKLCSPKGGVYAQVMSSGGHCYSGRRAENGMEVRQQPSDITSDC